MEFTLEGNLVDLEKRAVYPASVTVNNGTIIRIEKLNKKTEGFLLPGFVDAHIHIESSMLLPAAFAREAVKHGTVATVSDPHEIANVLGKSGVYYMLENASGVPFHFAFGAPSCVPATLFETAGDEITPADVEELMAHPGIYYLAEVMNFPAVISRNPEMMKKINAALITGKPIDGHAPGLRGPALDDYLSAGILTDHECFTYEEGYEKLSKGMTVIIREGSAARNFGALIPLIKEFPDKIMFCSDDKHPDDLMKGHINKLVSRAVREGYALFDVLHAACVAPVVHYRLPVGLLREGDPADFIRCENLEDFDVTDTYINGECVFENGISKITVTEAGQPNRFNCEPVTENDLRIKVGNGSARIICARDRQLITTCELEVPASENGWVVNDVKRDILKLIVYNRYKKANPACALIKNFGFHNGAIAGTVAHDSHNILATGSHDAYMAKAINKVIEHKGGICFSNGQITEILPLPVAGLMNPGQAGEVASAYERLNNLAVNAGCRLESPFMTLSFMALLVIPHLKLSDKGLFDADNFMLTGLFEDY